MIEISDEDALLCGSGGGGNKGGAKKGVNAKTGKPYTQAEKDRMGRAHNKAAFAANRAKTRGAKPSGRNARPKV